LIFPRNNAVNAAVLLTFSLAGAFLTSCDVSASESSAFVATQTTADPDLHAEWDRLLKEYVNDGRVDYDTWARMEQGALKNYLARLGEIDTEKLPKADQLAFGINLYNASMILFVMEKRAANPKWLPTEGDFAVFKEKRIVTKERTISLDDLEHRVLRPRFKDYRIHAALVCGAESCPKLLPRAYKASDLEETLDAQMKAFLSDQDRNRVDATSRTLHVSSLFDWFKDDFGGEEGVRKILTSHFGDSVKDYKVEFLPYSWKLNAKKKVLAPIR
jgi:hypothetical protein